VVVVCRSRRLAKRVQAGYQVELSDGRHRRDLLIEAVGAVVTRRARDVRAALAGADVIATAVQPHDLPAVGALVAQGLASRRQPATLLCFENTVGAGRRLRSLTLSAADGKKERRRLKDHVYSSALAQRIVSHRVLPREPGARLRLIGDLCEGWVIEEGPAAERLAEVPGVVAVDRHSAWVLRKLYTFSAGHAVAAYLGWLKGYHYIHTAIVDAEVRRAVFEAMEEGQRGIAHLYGARFAGGPEELEAIVRRFENPHLDDPLARAARDPRRKLRASDRLLGAAAAARKAGVEPRRLLQAAAAALCFADPHGTPLADRIAEDGLDSVLQRVCALDPSTHLGIAMCAMWDGLGRDWTPGSRLLSIERVMWAWSRSHDTADSL
jgi:mannitol-1-phosphate 5-dehydrogenase